MNERTRRWWGRRLATAFLWIGVAATGPAAADLYGPHSQELLDGLGGAITPGFAFANDALGRALAVGDFDGDGFDDLAIAEAESLLGQGEGAVHVLYGGPEGLSSTITLPSQLIYDFLPDSGALDREAGDDFGAALAAGDFDCDGYDDLAIGIPGEDVGGAADAGAVLALHGSAIGLVTSNLLGLEPRRFTEGSGNVGGTPESGDRFGAALAAGNFDWGSGWDLAVGIPGKNEGRGEIAILYSAIGSQGPCLFLGEAWTTPRWSQDSSGILDSAEPGDHFGLELAVGDFDGDHASDLAIGVPDEDLPGQPDAGAVAVLYGSHPGGLVSDRNQFWTEALAEAGGFSEAGDRFGEVLAAGDLDGDGIDDLAVGAPAEDVAFHPDAGAVTVLHGSASGITTAGSEILDQSIVLDGESLGDFDNFGYALAIGDFVAGAQPGNDLAIGIPQEGVGFPVVYAFEGAVTFVPGGGAALEVGQATLWSKGYFGSAGALVFSPEYYGYSLACGDFDGNGHDDLAIGAILVEGTSIGGTPVTSGAVYAIYGVLFADGFESGNTLRWSSVVGGCESCLREARR